MPYSVSPAAASKLVGRVRTRRWASDDGGRGAALVARRVGRRHLAMGRRRSSQHRGHSSSSSPPSFDAFAWYSNKLDTHPIVTKCVSAGLIASLGNVLAQRLVHGQNQPENVEVDDSGDDNAQRDASSGSRREPGPFTIDAAQVSRFALLNVAFVAPVLHHWYQFLGRALPGTSPARVWQRVFWDEFVFSPCYIPVFLGLLWKLEGSTDADVWAMTVAEVPSIIVAEWTVWVPTMAVTFRYVPVKFQVLAINVVGVAWQTFLAYVASHAQARRRREGEGTALPGGRDAAAAVYGGVAGTGGGAPFPEGGGDAGAAASGSGRGGVAVARRGGVAADKDGSTGTVFVEKMVAPLVLNTLVRRETPRHIEPGRLLPPPTTKTKTTIEDGTPQPRE